MSSSTIAATLVRSSVRLSCAAEARWALSALLVNSISYQWAFEPCRRTDGGGVSDRVRDQRGRERETETDLRRWSLGAAVGEEIQRGEPGGDGDDGLTSFSKRDLAIHRTSVCESENLAGSSSMWTSKTPEASRSQLARLNA